MKTPACRQYRLAGTRYAISYSVADLTFYEGIMHPNRSVHSMTRSAHNGPFEESTRNMLLSISGFHTAGYLR